MQILRATSEYANDLTQISILAKSHWEYPQAWIQLWTPSLTLTAEYIDTHEVWMMVSEGRPLAFYSFDENEEGFWLDNLWVSPAYMGQGIGRSLFQHALERCKTLGISTLKIEADPNARNFYERMGAHQVGEHSTEIQGEPRILPVMEINL
jgi:GNAT superfamily N-acetyltransferase